MKKIISLLLLIPILSITGCSKLKSDTAIHSLMSKDDEVIELSPIELINLVTITLLYLASGMISLTGDLLLLIFNPQLFIIYLF
jgi:hypothetical protein